MSHIIAPSRIEPARLEDQIPLDLVETANRLIQASQTLGRNLPSRTLADLAAMVRMMNSYYSNRIEGNNTRPRDIERALAGDYDADPERRALQQEHAAHVRLQAEIDRQAAAGTLGDPSDPDFVRWLHRSFYEGATDEMLTLRHAGQEVRIIPGEWRGGDVEVGAHVPPPHGAVAAFMAHFRGRFRLDWLHGQVNRTLAIATAHHRFNYIHPFYDGNGRVSRLMSHAMTHHAGIAAGGLAPLCDLRDRVTLELVCEIACSHHGLPASKLAKKASTKHGAIQKVAWPKREPVGRCAAGLQRLSGLSRG